MFCYIYIKFGITEFSSMSKAPQRSPSDRMIHIRLDEETCRLIKVQAAQHGMTIQRLVENIIRQQVVITENRDAKI